MPRTLVVTNAPDTGVNVDGSLRGEIAAAQSGDTIVFDGSLAGQTITLDPAKVRGFLAHEPKLAPYRMYIEETLRRRPHTLSAAEERVAAEAGELERAGHEVHGHGARPLRDTVGVVPDLDAGQKARRVDARLAGESDEAAGALAAGRRRDYEHRVVEPADERLERVRAH